MEDFSGQFIPVPKFQHRYFRHLALFLATLLTTTWAGAEQYFGFQQSIGHAIPRVLPWTAIFEGFWYSLPVLVILGLHEFGHYVYCRKHNVDATLPYFIPVPLVLMTGTLGAVIRIREAFPSKKSLFDIGVAGPIAGFIALIPFLYLGICLSPVVHIAPNSDGIFFGDPMLLKMLRWIRYGPLPADADLMMHPMLFAAWWGMLATALNLLPFGQLDGGHITYAVFGRRAAAISLATLGTVVLLTARSMSWVSVTVMMLLMAFVVGFRHPRIVDEETPLDARRVAVAVFALVMFVLCFTPVPIRMFLKGR